MGRTWRQNWNKLSENRIQSRHRVPYKGMITRDHRDSLIFCSKSRLIYHRCALHEAHNQFLYNHSMYFLVAVVVQLCAAYRLNRWNMIPTLKILPPLDTPSIREILTINPHPTSHKLPCIALSLLCMHDDKPLKVSALNK